ncbi:ABC-2 family transporter protein [Kribbella sp. NBC_01505]|uniref:ABC transporter permease n=1 Tax=Kribbella sp. NBC_01505 TaxID=2903580 RepID=UPI003864C0CD
MVDLLRDFRILLRVAWLTELEHKANLFISVIGALAFNAGQLLFIGVLLDAFGSIAGWSPAEIMVLFGIRIASHSVYAFFFRRVIDVDLVVHTGEFDRYLLRPTSPFLQLLTRRFNLQQFGDVIIAAAILALALPRAPIDWHPLLVVWLVIAIAAGGMLEGGLQLARGALAFRLQNTQSLTGLIDAVFGTYGNFPLQIFGTLGSILFTVALPLAFVAWIPAAMITGRVDSLWFPAWLGWLSPAAGVVCLVASIAFFTRQSRHYSSPGS